mgnify:CR=1 FL=1
MCESDEASDEVGEGKESLKQNGSRIKRSWAVIHAVTARDSEPTSKHGLNM